MYQVLIHTINHNSMLDTDLALKFRIMHDTHADYILKKNHILNIMELLINLHLWVCKK